MGADLTSRSVLAAGSPFRPRWSHEPAFLLALAALPVAFLLAAAGGVFAALFPLAVLGLAAVVAFAVLVLVRPVVAAYVLFAVTPLIAGIDRGKILPILRPHEALVPLLAGILLIGGIWRHATQGRPLRFRPVPVDLAILLLLVTGSVAPLLWMFARGKEPSQEDFLYAVRFGHYVAVYLIVRLSVREERQVRTCLLLSVSVACAVAVIGILEVLGLFGVAGFLAAHYGIEGTAEAATRATATTSSPFAFSDILLFNLALCVGFFLTGTRRLFLLGASILLLFGVMASGQFSALIGLLVTAGAISFLLRRRLALVALVPPLLAASLALKPVIAARISEIDPSVGLPKSWLHRLDNLTTYFWPELSSHFNYLLGVRPSVEVLGFYDWEGVVYIESGHTWLLWIGGIPFFVAFWIFAWAALKRAKAVASGGWGSYRVAGIGSFCALLVVVVLMTVDAHLTLRASADLNFALLALAVGAPIAASRTTQPKPRSQPAGPNPPPNTLR